MDSLLQHILIVLVPLIISNSLHMVVVKKQYLSLLKAPIWKKGLGENKTWRGFVFVPIVNGIIVVLFSIGIDQEPPQAFVMGLLLGICYMIAELPNSYLKRRMGIDPGAESDTYPHLFFVLDKTDSAFGVVLGYYLLADISVPTALILFFICSLSHMFFSIVLVRLQIKSNV